MRDSSAIKGFAFLMVGIVIVAALFPRCVCASVRIKDVTSIAGMQNKQLIGYGLVVGLNGTGDGKKSTFTVNSIVSMLEKFGVTVSASEIQVKNVAAVVVTAEVEPFTPVGSRLDVTVSSIGDASSLEGGMLLLTPLRSQEGNTYAIAQGPVSIGGFNIEAGAGNVVRKNHSTIGRVPDGALVKKRAETRFANNSNFTITLDNADFQSATNIANHINIAYQMKLASAVNSKEITIKIPPGYSKNPVAFVARVGKMEVELDNVARVVINERTGTVVVGERVTIDEVAVAHGNLKVEIKARYAVSQPSPMGMGESIVVPEVETKVEDREARLLTVRQSSTVSEIASALNELGVSPRDIIAIFQAIKEAGALKAELVIM
jgi:flagellar P-ring protein precursor FlgI